LNTSVQINWNATIPIIIQANVTGVNPLTQIQFNITDAANYSTNVLYTNPNKTSALITITYVPTYGEYTNFVITANDTQSLSVSSTLTGILICGCQSLDLENTCLFDTTQTVINPSINQVKCSCLPYYTGE